MKDVSQRLGSGFNFINFSSAALKLHAFASSVVHHSRFDVPCSMFMKINAAQETLLGNKNFEPAGTPKAALCVTIVTEFFDPFQLFLYRNFASNKNLICDTCH